MGKAKNCIKGFNFIVCLMFSILMIIVGTTSKAATQNPTLYFGITERRASGLGYSIGNPNANDGTATAMKIWNIVQYSGANTNDPTETNVYCVKAGVGFTEGDGVRGTEEYNLKFDMYTDRDEIASQNDVLNGLVNGGHYNELLALANIIYLPGESTDDEKEQLLQQAGILNMQQEYPSDEYNITDDEIEAIQQAAVWYFTNY